MTLAEARDDLLSLDGHVSSFERCIRANIGTLPKSYIGAWVSFRREWNEFYYSFSSLSRSLQAEATDKYGQQIKKWQGSFFELTHPEKTAVAYPVPQR